MNLYPQRTPLAVDYEDGRAHFQFVQVKAGALPYISFEGPLVEDPSPSLARLMAAGRVYSAVRDYVFRTGDIAALRTLAKHDETLAKIILPALDLKGGNRYAVSDVQGAAISN